MLDEKYDVAIARITESLSTLGYSELKCHRVSGQSMEPTIRDGSFLWYAPCGRTLIDGGIYIINMGELGVWVKRIVRNPEGLLAISDNKGCGYLKLPDDGSNIMGRVVWMLQKT